MITRMMSNFMIDTHHPRTFDPMKNFMIHPTATVDEGATIGDGTKIWHYCHVMPSTIIGEGCILGQNVFVGHGVRLGSGTKLQNNVSIYTGVTIDENVFIGPSVVFTNVINPRAFIERKEAFMPTHVEQGASIGANATIRCGVRIGAYAMIGAGALVTKDVKPYSLVIGHPARHVGWRSKAGHELIFVDGIATCPEMGEAYRLTNETVTLC